MSPARIAVGWAVITGAVVATLLQMPLGAWWAMLAYHGGCVFAARWAGGTLGPKPAASRWMAWGPLTALAVSALGGLAHGAGWRFQPAAAWAAWGLVSPGEPWLLLYYVAVNPWIEEWFWRGTLLGNEVREAIGRRGARALAVLGFWPLHAVVLVSSFGWVEGGLLSLSCVAAGAFWTVLRERQGHGWGAAASHQGADAGVLALYWLFLRGPQV